MLPSKNAITVFMHRVLTAYSKYFNAKHQRTGALFESKFKSVHISKDNQAKYLFSYIHLNPIKLIDAKWKERGIKNKKNVINFLDYFKTKREFQKEIFDWINIKLEE